MSEPIRIGLRDARDNLAEILMRARYKGESFLIAKHGEPLALVIPISSVPTLQPVDVTASLTPAQKRWGVLARMVQADSKT